MKLTEFINKLELAYKEPNYYLKGGWGKWNGSKWGWDCVCLIKGILWGWDDNKNKPRGGGAVYGSNGVPDIGTEQIIKVCNNVSTDFSNIKIGELVWMKGHVGIYVGEGHVIEATCGWNKDKVVKSDIAKDGTSSLNGVKRLKWQKHGFLPYVDYGEEDYWTKGKYKTLVSKYIRTSPKVANNYVLVKECMASVKPKLTSQKPNDKARFKIGVTVELTAFEYDSKGNLWARMKNSYICVKDSTGDQVVKK